MTNRLGKGLGALIQNDQPNNDNKEYTLVDIRKVKPNKDQPRKTFEPKEIEELSLSIKEHGIIQPIIVNKSDNGYLIIAGERRFRAAKKAELKEIPVIIKNYSPQELMEIALIENLQRVDLNIVEEALGIKELMEKHNLTQEEVAKKLSKSRSDIANTLRLLQLCPPVLNMLRENKLSKGHAKCLMAIEDIDLQLILAKKTVEEGLSVRSLEGKIKDIGKEKKVAPSPRQEIVEFEEKLCELLSTRVKVVGNEEKGSIKIDYYSSEELNHIYDTLIKR